MLRRILAYFLLSAAAFGACHVTTPSGAGTNSGADYNNACAGFTGACSSANLVRGDVYYVSKGTYSSAETPTASKANSGTSTITIKANTVADHGQACSPSVAAGWVEATHVGQAVFSDQISFTTDYWIIDGVYGTPFSKGSYGIKMNPPVTTDWIMKGAGGMGNSTIRYVEIAGNQNCSGHTWDVGIFPGQTGGGGDNLVAEFNYIYQVGNHFKVNGSNNVIIQGS